MTRTTTTAVCDSCSAVVYVGGLSMCLGGLCVQVVTYSSYGVSNDDVTGVLHVS